MERDHRKRSHGGQKTDGEILDNFQTRLVRTGILIGPTHALEPEVPWANIVAFVEAVEEYGWY